MICVSNFVYLSLASEDLEKQLATIRRVASLKSSTRRANAVNDKFRAIECEFVETAATAIHLETEVKQLHFDLLAEAERLLLEEDCRSLSRYLQYKYQERTPQVMAAYLHQQLAPTSYCKGNVQMLLPPRVVDSIISSYCVKLQAQLLEHWGTNRTFALKYDCSLSRSQLEYVRNYISCKDGEPLVIHEDRGTTYTLPKPPGSTAMYKKKKLTESEYNLTLAGGGAAAFIDIHKVLADMARLCAAELNAMAEPTLHAQLTIDATNVGSLQATNVTVKALDQNPHSKTTRAEDTYHTQVSSECKIIRVLYLHKLLAHEFSILYLLAHLTDGSHHSRWRQDQ